MMKFEGTFDSICPITRVAVGEIVHPVGIRGFPQHAYEMDALAVWVRRSGSDPLTRKAMLLSSVVALEMAGRDSEETKKGLKLLQHEMNVLAPNQEVAMAYVAGFKRAFDVQANGTLRCDRDVRANAPGWYNAQRWFIQFITDAEPPVLVLSEPREGRGGDIATTNKNKIEMVYAYVYAFIVYQKICKSLGLELGPYTSKIEVGIDIIDASFSL